MRVADAARPPAAALAFLTRVPVARLVALDGRDVARGAALFPLVGAGIGAAVGGAAAGLVHALPPLGAAGIALDLLVKAASLAALASHGGVVGAAIAAGALSRAVPALHALALPRARSDGAGAAFRVPAAAALAAAAAGCALALAAGPAHGAVLCAVAAGAALLLGLAARRLLGG